MIGLLFGQFLIWALGSACVAVVWQSSLGSSCAVSRSDRAITIGYGYPIGTLLLAIYMRLLSAIGIPWSFLSIAAPMLAVAAGFFLMVPASHRRKLFGLQSIGGADAAVVEVKTRMRSVLCWVICTLIAAHLVMQFLEIVWRPLFPWDAWTQWATKARVWYETSRLAPFSDVATWLGGNTYIDAAPAYPANVPLMQVWACITIGSWDDSLMNMPSVFFAAGLAVALYGQMRYAGRGALLSISAAYAALSLPILDTHVALGGYADFPLAVYFSLSAIALWQWSICRDRRQLVLAVILAIACPLTKNPGWAWLATLIPALVVAFLPARGVLVVGALSLTGLLLAVAFGRADVTVWGYHVGGTYHAVWEPIWQNYYQFANWHLLWYVLPVLMLWNARRLFRPPLVAGTMIVMCGFAFLFIVFSFSNAAAWVTDYSTVNRATLHFAPLLVFYLFFLLRENRASMIQPTTADAGSASANALTSSKILNPVGD